MQHRQAARVPAELRRCTMRVDVVVAHAQRARREVADDADRPRAPIAGHHIQWIGSCSNASSTAYTARVTQTDATPITPPSSM